MKVRKKLAKDKSGEHVAHLEITEVMCIHCNIANNDYQQVSRVLYLFVPNKPFAQLLEILSTNFIFLKIFNTEFSFVKVWFIDQNRKLLEINIDISLII